MTHADAIELIKNGGPVVRLLLRRSTIPPSMGTFLFDSGVGLSTALPSTPPSWTKSLKAKRRRRKRRRRRRRGGKTQTESNRTKLRNGSHQRNSIGVSNDTSSLMLKWVQIVQSWFLSSAILFLMAFLCGFSLIVIYHSIEGSILRNQLRLLVFHSSEELMLCETILQDSLVEPISVGSSLISNDSTLNPSS